jgi:hypothetical protein
MTTPRNDGNASLNDAAEMTGRTLGRGAGTLDSLQARHPHPVTEAHSRRAPHFKR